MPRQGGSGGLWHFVAWLQPPASSLQSSSGGKGGLSCVACWCQCWKEKSVLTPRWNCFFDLLSVTFATIIIRNGLPQRILPPAWLLNKCLCPELCAPVDGKEETDTSPGPRLAILGDVCKINGLFMLLPHLLPSLIYKRTWHPDPIVWFIHSIVSDSATPWTAARQASLSITNSQSSLKLTSIESVMPSNHLILCHSLLLLPSQHQGLFQTPQDGYSEVPAYHLLDLLAPDSSFFLASAPRLSASLGPRAASRASGTWKHQGGQQGSSSTLG